MGKFLCENVNQRSFRGFFL